MKCIDCAEGNRNGPNNEDGRIWKNRKNRVRKVTLTIRVKRISLGIVLDRHRWIVH